jgi:hypothetical protein
MAYGFIPTAWRQVKVTITTEKLVDRHIRDGALKKYPLHRNQHAYQIAKSTETAIYNVVTRIESDIEYKDIALEAFLDIEGAFDRTSFYIIKRAAENHGIEPIICRWICAILESMNIIATLSRENLGASAARGCPQGGVLSPVLWSLVVDILLCELSINEYYTIGYADDIEILTNKKILYTVSEVSQTACAQSKNGVKEKNCLSTQRRRKLYPLLGRGIERDLRNQSSSTKRSSYPAKSSTLN